MIVTTAHTILTCFISAAAGYLGRKNSATKTLWMRVVSKVNRDFDRIDSRHVNLACIEDNRKNYLVGGTRISFLTFTFLTGGMKSCTLCCTTLEHVLSTCANKQASTSIHKRTGIIACGPVGMMKM